MPSKQLDGIEAQIVALENAVQVLKRVVEERLPEKQIEPPRPSLTLVKGESDA